MADVKALAEELVNLSVKDVRNLLRFLRKSTVSSQLQQQLQLQLQLLAARLQQQSRQSSTLSSSQLVTLNLTLSRLSRISSPRP